MRKIAIAAIALALLTAVANIHVASAEAAPASKEKPLHTASEIIKTAQQTAPTPPAPAPAPEPIVNTVVPGDTLSGIADSNGTTYMRLYDANTFINDPDLIFPGQQIRVPAPDEQIADRATPVETAPTPDPVAADPAPASDPSAAADTETAPAPAPAPATPTAEPAPAPVAEAPAPTPAVSSSDAAAKAYIYMHESSNNPNATNYLGCYGLGQDCNGQLRTLCGADYECQDRFFTNYALTRYGSWANAEAFWQAHSWW